MGFIRLPNDAAMPERPNFSVRAEKDNDTLRFIGCVTLALLFLAAFLLGLHAGG